MDLMAFLAIAEIGLGIFSALQGGGGGGGIYGGGGDDGGGGGGILGQLGQLFGFNFGADLIGVDIGGGSGSASGSSASSSSGGGGYSFHNLPSSGTQAQNLGGGTVSAAPAAGGFPAPTPAVLTASASDIHPDDPGTGTGGGTDPPSTGDTFSTLGAILQGAGSVIEERENENRSISQAVTPGASPTFQGGSAPARNVNLEAMIQAMFGGGGGGRK